MDRLVGISIGALQKRYGDIRALEIASQIGADAVDFALEDEDNDYRNQATSSLNNSDLLIQIIPSHVSPVLQIS